MVVFGVLCLVLAIAYYAYVKYQRRNMPPGPFPYPLIGNMIEAIMTDPERHYVGFQKLAKKYGNVFSYKLGVVPCVVVNGLKELKDIMNSGCLNNRQDESWMLDRAEGNTQHGLFFSTVNAWKDNRRYTQRTLKDFGFGKIKSMDELILEEFQVLVKDLKKAIKENNGILHVELTFNAAFVNIIYTFLTGTRFDHSDPRLLELVFLSNEWFASSNIGGGALGFYPFLIHLAPEWSGFGRNHRSNEKMRKYFTELVEEFQRNGNYKNNPTNFIEVFLQRINEGPKHADYDHPIFTVKNLVCLLNDLFTAGSETSAHSTSFAVRRFIQEPRVQAKLQAEIDSVIGKDRWVMLSDRPNLKYTEATMLEVLRSDTVVPVGPRKTNAPYKLGEYVIPEGTNVLTNYYSGNMDKEVWEDPEAFRPERFLDENGNIINAEKITSFAFGKRDCIGISVAKNTLFMAIATFAQHFNFGIDPATGMPGRECTKTITMAPLPYNTLVTIRR